MSFLGRGVASRCPGKGSEDGDQGHSACGQAAALQSVGPPPEEQGYPNGDAGAIPGEPGKWPEALRNAESLHMRQDNDARRLGLQPKSYSKEVGGGVSVLHPVRSSNVV